MPEGAPKESYWSLKVENPYRETHVYVTKHHYCSFYGGKKNPCKEAAPEGSSTNRSSW